MWTIQVRSIKLVKLYTIESRKLSGAAWNGCKNKARDVAKYNVFNTSLFSGILSEAV